MSIAQNVINEVRRIIHDESEPYRWEDAELLDYTNAAIRQTVQLVPEAYTIETIENTGTSRVARQVLPAGGIKFIKVGRNYADDGTTPQGVVRYVEKDVLDTYDPDWEYDATLKADGANFFEHFCHDPKEPVVYYLYPPPAADNKRLAVVYSAVPTALAVVADTIPIPDEYFNALVMYVIYRALTKEARETLPDDYRQDLWQNYLGALGAERQIKASISPDQSAPPDGT